MDDSRTNKEVLLRFDDPETGRAVVLEDDGRVAYAYLLDKEEVVADVWLYNVEKTPDAANWNDESQMPFLNPRKFCKDEPVPRLGHQCVVVCVWSDESVEVAIDGVLMARLESGVTPGWSRLAREPGPLAKPLETNT